jgi:hypothetical protein
MSQPETLIDTPSYTTGAVRRVEELKLNDGNVIPMVTMTRTTVLVLRAGLN